MSEIKRPEESGEALHERFRMLREWTALSPKIDYFIVKGRLVDNNVIIRNTLEPRSDLELGIQQAADLSNSEDSQPLAKDYSVSSIPSSTPKKTSKEVTDAMAKVAASTLVRTYSQLNFGVQIGIYPRSVRRHYPVGISSEGPPFTLPTDTEVIKVLLSDYLKAVKPDKITHETKLIADLGMTGTSLTGFEDELEYYGFQRPRLDLTIQETAGEIIEKLSEQKEVVESLRSIVLFPRTKGYYKAQRIIESARHEAEGVQGQPAPMSWASAYFTTLTKREAEGSVTFRQVLGTPVFTCEAESDFQALRPIEQRKIQPNTYIYSYVINRLSRIYPLGEIQDIPIIVRRNGFSDRDVLQHARTQLAFARKVKSADLSPVLASSAPLDFEEDVRQKVRSYLLAILVSQTQAVDWYRDEEEKPGNSPKISQLFPNDQREIFGKDRPLYMGNWLSARQKIMDKSVKAEIFEEVQKQMRNDLRHISRLILIKLSVEWQVFVANYLSLFDDWEGAERTFQGWEYRNAFRESFGITPPPSTDLFRERAPEV